MTNENILKILRKFASVLQDNSSLGPMPNNEMREEIGIASLRPSQAFTLIFLLSVFLVFFVEYIRIFYIWTKTSQCALISKSPEERRLAEEEQTIKKEDKREISNKAKISRDREKRLLLKLWNH